LPDDRNVVQSPGIEPLDHIAAPPRRLLDAVFADFPVRLRVKLRSRDQDAELVVPKPRDESA
jgi:hypothetical protein